MRLTDNGNFIPKAAIAAVVGSAMGAGAALWSLNRPAATAGVAAPPARTTTAAAPVEPPRSPAVDTGVSTPPAQSSPLSPAAPATNAETDRATVSPTPEAASLKPAASPPPPAAPGDSTEVLSRARALARRPDVTALIALRESVLRRATERGDADSLAVKSELAELDQYLNDARTLRLKLDADEFHKASDVRRGR